MWHYHGPLPALTQARIVVSLLGHTAHVSGIIPKDWDGTLPAYAEVEDVSDGRQLHVVYPIATGKLNGRTLAGTPVRNSPGTFRNLLAYPFKERDAIAAWGGFPFLIYNQSREIGFHGPITHPQATWHLQRGPVSHGCNRMQGEHVVEMAHLVGVDMDQTYRQGQSVTVGVPVEVLATDAGYDELNGEELDVDYPTTSGVKRPTGTVHMFATWSGLDHPEYVCQAGGLNPC